MKYQHFDTSWVLWIKLYFYIFKSATFQGIQPINEIVLSQSNKKRINKKIEYNKGHKELINSLRYQKQTQFLL